MLKASIEGSFSNLSVEQLTMYKPRLSTTLLEKMKWITFKACHGLVSLEFLERGLESMLAARNGLFTLESFKTTDAEMIRSLLDRCFNRSRRLRFRKEWCSGEVSECYISEFCVW
jgi:hypothetical protein